ncbi:RND family efflux transporter, MFP subunit [Fontibacillus panacisegetis]|uniref:RND family efflux transporter, MFP subunit n=1 Tax=Fontibacillus panacisegetis TaxID=670482 RepID=A0A1G7VB61_9BACL|nr:efflux RND transporter periplasmic adaptor subunit [Fontibacillus panacisegetis]SDG56967.1 RND family efflux transporter, MFP subunit [Fontibacillus panacisegetis]
MMKWAIRRGRSITLVGISLLLIIISGCTTTNETNPLTSEEKVLTQVKVTEVKGYDFGDPKQLMGEVTAKQKMDVATRVSGEVKTLYVKRGDHVKKGQKILSFNNERLKILQEKQQQELKYLQSQYALAVREDTGIEQLTLQMEQAVLALKEINLDQKNQTVVAPIDGVITQLSTIEGSAVVEGTPVATIQQLDPVVIVIKLSEYDLGLIKLNQQLDFNLVQPSGTFQGKVTYISPVIDMETKAFNAEVEVKNEKDQLKAGMQVSTILDKKEDQNILALPSKTIVWEDDNSFVFVLKETKVEKRQVELGRVKENLQEIISGVKEGEKVVTEGHSRLKDQEEVQVIE